MFNLMCESVIAVQNVNCVAADTKVLFLLIFALMLQRTKVIFPFDFGASINYKILKSTLVSETISDNWKPFKNDEKCLS